VERGEALFGSIVVYENYPVGEAMREAAESGPSLRVSNVEAVERTNYPIAIISSPGGRMPLCATYDRTEYEEETMKRMLGHLRNVIVGMSVEVRRRVSELEMLSEEERRQLLEEWNWTEAEYPKEKCVHELFEEQAERTPEAVALEYEGQEISYGELNRRANQLGQYLKRLGVGPEVLVGVYLERSVEMIIALIGVLKAGGVYVPIDPANPKNRVGLIVEDAELEIIVTKEQLREALSAQSARLIGIDRDWREIERASERAPQVKLDRENLVCVLYTSGSTGKPKGVEIKHGGLINYISYRVQELKMREDDRCLQFASFGFDTALEEVFLTLTSGARLILRNDRMLNSVKEFLETCEEWWVSVLVLPTSYWHEIVEEIVVNKLTTPKRMRLVAVGGELVLEEKVRDWHEQVVGVNLYHEYGPTEATVVALMEEMSKEGSGDVTIGRPISNTSAYILGEGTEPMPVGVTGEIYIGGEGVARGYLKIPDLTAERFVPDSHSGKSGARAYRTGDLGRYLVKGNIEFLGRIDHQVKIRGFRVELGEIEATLRQHSKVKDVVALTRLDSPGEKRLVAYVVAKDGGTTVEQLKSWLRGRLPEYMIPSALVVRKNIPITTNGKVDRNALLKEDTDGPHISINYVPPRSYIELELKQIWENLFGVGPIGVTDNFFELGGHSLLAMRIISRLRQTLGVEVALADLFAHPVLADLARKVEGAAQAELPPITVVNRSERLELSYAQRRLWFLAQFEGASEAYHVAGGLRLRGQLDREALRRALDRIVARHEALRTTFRQIDGHPIQVIGSAEKGFQLREHDLRGEADAEGELERLVEQEAREAFDLERGPLIRGGVAQLGEEEHALFMTMHHIVSDGWSMGILINEISELYRAYRAGEEAQLAELAIQYGDYAAWQQRWMSAEVMERQAEYWKSVLVGAPALLELPTDRARPAVQDYAGGSVVIELGERLTNDLKALSRRHGTTLYMTLLAGWAALLGRLSGQEEVVIGTPVANRRRVEIEGLIGFFVNTLALRIDLSGGPRIGKLLERVKARTVEGQQNQDIPFEQVVELAQPVRSLSHAPIFQVMFAWQNAPEGRLELPGLRITPMRVPSVTAIFDLTLSLQEAGEGIAGGVEYASALYDWETVERYLGYWRRLLEGMAAAEDEVIDHLALLGKAERRQLLEEWNETQAEYPKEKLIQELFEEQVERRPEAIALTYEDEQMSYGELNTRANQLARHLRGVGVEPDMRVALLLERSIDLVVAQLAALKSGAAYVPIDPSFPDERQVLIATDCAARVVITTKNMRLPEALRTPRVNLDDPSLVAAGAGNLNLAYGSEMTAYVMYTSGSTGRPKGVMAPHRAIGRLVLNCGYADFNVEDRVAFAANPAFDAATMEVWAPLLNGGRVVVIDQNCLLEPSRFAQALKRHEVSVLWLTAGLLNQYEVALTEALGALRYLIVGGDALDPHVIAELLRRNPPRHLVNGYGPTETTTFAITHEVRAVPEGAKSIPLGRPISNTRVYNLDTNQQPAPMGVSGEIHISGAGVARGYLNRPDLTAERFLPDPYGREPGARMYKTGDLGCWLPEGKIEFLGRNDSQVKIRGFRIELGEIEAKLADGAKVREAVVVAREEGEAGKRLVAYYTGQEVGAEALRERLRTALPEYMIPAAYVHLESMPLTANGKLDRRALPAAGADAYVRRGYEPPSGETEARLARIWGELLKVERVGRQDNFFELGGHSLIAISVVSKCRQLDIPILITDLFTHPTIESLASYVLSRKDGSLEKSVAIPLRTEGAESPLFLVHELSGEMFYGPLLVPHLAPGFPVYGLASPKFSEAPLRTIEAMGRRMIGMIRAVQPEGPYRIAGWSLGATLAYEIATQLIGEDASVEFLGSLDGEYAGPKLKMANGAGSEMTDKDLLVDVLSNDEEQYLILKRLSDEAPSFDDLVRACQERGLITLPIDDVRRYMERMSRNWLAMRKYIVYPIPIPLHLFAAAGNIDDTTNPLRSWELALPAEQVRVIRVPGGHRSMMEPPHIASLGEALSQALRQAREIKAPQPEKEYRPLLSIRDGSGVVPVLCVPGAGSTIVGFLDLAEGLEKIGPIEGLQPRGLDRALVPHATVQAAARAYVQCVEQKYPEGAVHLLGHSFGGWIAFEMAQLLGAAGRSVASLTILDSDPPEGDGADGREYWRTEALMKLVELYEQIAEHSLEIGAEQLEALDQCGQLELLAERLVWAELRPRGMQAADLIGTVRTFEATLRTRYRPEKVYRYPVWLVLANDPKKDQQVNEEDFARVAAGWRRWAPDLKVWRSPGSHMTMLSKPHVRALADWLSSMLSTIDS
jgi:syringomycin synthetase protein SyrE